MPEQVENRVTVTVAISAVGYTLSRVEVQRATDAYLAKRVYMRGYMRDRRGPETKDKPE